jgi:phosphatidylglycerophosphatase A
MNPASLLATWFGAGKLPKAPGTWGSLAALPFAWVIRVELGMWALAAATVLIFAIGCWAAGAHARSHGGEDPGEVVIDEVAGQWLTLLPVAADPILYLAGFILFRIFDVWKPWPVRWADRAIGGGFGIMLDDVLAALYAGGLLCIAVNVVGVR